MAKRRQQPQNQPPAQPVPAKPTLWIYAVLFAATMAVYAQTARFDFVNFDDPDYVTANPHVRGGFSAENFAWAFTSGDAANWFPLTRLSHMLDYQLFGMSGGGHHLVNVLLHAIAVLLLFAFLNRATGRKWLSAWVALMFALHPLHVESVAWVAEQKDVLSTVFAMLALLGYVRWVERPSMRRYLLCALAFGLGLMAKPMIVTLPLLFVLLDIWPLGRGPRWREKIPLFAMSAASAVVTFAVQQAGGAVRTREQFPLLLRSENAAVSYVAYLFQWFWPSRLAVFYPYPAEIPLWMAGSAALAIGAFTLLAWRSRGERPYVAAGWFWYLVMLAPVIGLVQVGAQARADRYTYMPTIGISIVLAWGAAEFVARMPAARTAAIAMAVCSCAAAAAVTVVQIGYWRDSRTLFQHAVNVTESNYLAHHNLGVALADEGRFPEAITQYRAALQIEPNAANVQTDYGNALAKSGQIPEAIEHYEAALRVLPDSPIAHNDLANALAVAPGRVTEAIAEYRTALRLKPDYEEARKNLAQVQSNAAETEYNLGVDLAKGRKAEAAIPHFEEALRLKPDYVDAHNNLGVVLAGDGRVREAISHFEAALRIDPDSDDAHVNLAIALSGMPGRTPEAIRHFEAALRIKPDPEIRQMLDRLEKTR